MKQFLKSFWVEFKHALRAFLPALFALFVGQLCIWTSDVDVEAIACDFIDSQPDASTVLVLCGCFIASFIDGLCDLFPLKKRSDQTEV